MEPIKVVVNGASGRMGRELVAALCRDPEVEPVGAVEKNVAEEYLSLPDGSGLIPFSSDLEAILIRSRPHVLADFTAPEATMPAVRTAIRHGVRLVVGTTGLTSENVAEIAELCQRHEVGGVVAPNFALGAVLLIHLVKVAARFFDYAEVIELHHEAKADAPSGTALLTAQEMVKARGQPFLHPITLKETIAGTRGGEVAGVTIHSVRLPGLVAHQEVILGGLGQTLSLRHDSISRESFLPGILRAIKEVVQLRRLVYGLDALLGL